MYLADDIASSTRPTSSSCAISSGAVPSALGIVDAINNQILSGELYKALKETKRLVAYEAELLAHATGSASLR
jgi:flagellar protein FlbT